MHKKQRKYYSILLVVFCPQGRRDAVCHLSFFSYLTNSREKGKEGREKCIAGALGRASTEAHCTREGEGRRNERVVRGWRALARLNGSPLHSDHALLPPFSSLLSTLHFSLIPLPCPPQPQAAGGHFLCSPLISRCFLSIIWIRE